jgi:hypothetical protein
MATRQGDRAPRVKNRAAAAIQVRLSPPSLSLLAFPCSPNSAFLLDHGRAIAPRGTLAYTSSSPCLAPRAHLSTLADPLDVNATQAQERQENVFQAPKQRVEDLEELQEYRGRKRKEFEDRIRYSRSSVSLVPLTSYAGSPVPDIVWSCRYTNGEDTLRGKPVRTSSTGKFRSRLALPFEASSFNRST